MAHIHVVRHFDQRMKKHVIFCKCNKNTHVLFRFIQNDVVLELSGLL